MKEEDKNTQFFHRTVRMHNARNKILRLQNEDGNTIEDYNKFNKQPSTSFKTSSLNHPLRMITFCRIGLGNHSLQNKQALLVPK